MVEAANSADAVVDVLTEAFLDDPVFCWMFPDQERRRRVLPHVYRPRAQRSLVAGELFVTGDGAGASLWLPVRSGHAGSTGVASEMERVRIYVDLVSARRPRDVAYLHLEFIGVLPERRRCGLGAAMLRHRLARADAESTSVYLEASAARNRALYRQHGFTDLGAPISLPDGPTLWPMWREPNNREEQA